MQVAGVACFACGKTVGTVGQAVGCQACRTVAHQECATTEVCPSCGRRLEDGQALHAAPTAPAGAGGLQGIRGWLALFVIQVSIAAVGGVVVGGMVLFGSPSPEGIVIGIVSVALGFYGGFCLRLLWNESRSAPTYAQWYLGLLAVFGLGMGLYSGNMNGAGRGLLAWAVWGTYLLRSNRVAAVYRKVA